MNYRGYILAITLILLTFLKCKQPSDIDQPPNVILILVDDMGFSDIGAYGSEIETPNIDRLAFEGVRFTNAYNTSKCFPSRACILTGLYSQQIGYHKTFRLKMKNAITLGELFKTAGYTTLWSGKHHSIENPITRGFDHYSGLLDGASNHFNPGVKRTGEGQPAQKGWMKSSPSTYRNWVVEGEIFNPYTPESRDFYTTDVFTDYALNWINEVDKKKPFFLYLAYTAPHDPLMAWPEDIEKYKDRYNLGYKKIRQNRFKKQKELGILPENAQLSNAAYNNWGSLSVEDRADETRAMEVYAAMIDRLDQNIGKILSILENQKKLENTLIVFASDNGGVNERDQINATFSRQLSETLIARVSSTYQEIRSASGGNSNDIRKNFSVSPSIAWNFSSNVNLSLSYKYRHQKDSQVGTDVDSNAIMLTLNYDWDGLQISR